jgi:thiol-disulfide isomerase/thioredoxin
MKSTALLCAGVLLMGSLTMLGASQESRPVDGGAMRVALTSQSPSEGKALRWSPKGAKIALQQVGGRLQGSIVLGPGRKSVEGRVGAPTPMTIWLTKSEGAQHVDHMWLDRNGDGKVSADEQVPLAVSESRGKFWSSGEVTLQLALPAQPVEPGESGRLAPAMRDYPMSFWFVEDPAEPDQEPALRWSRKGWHQGEVRWNGAPMHVLITDMKMDGVFDEQDAWSLSRDGATLAREASSRPTTRHAWLGEEAFRMTAVDPNGTWIELESYDPGVTRAAEFEADDKLREDKLAVRASAPLAFGHDYEAAVAQAKAEGKVLLVDFETTWCGPCKTMDALVYTAKDVVDAATARGIVAVKVDGDDHRDLKKAFAVEAFPTMILLDFSSGAKVELDRRVGYNGVKDMAAFLKGAAAK